MKFKLKNRKAFGYGLLAGNVVYQLIILLLVKFNERFSASYNARNGLTIGLLLIMVALYYIRYPVKEEDNGNRPIS